MNTSDITKLLHQREPYLMVSEITECDQKKIIAKKIFSGEEFFLKGHFPLLSKQQFINFVKTNPDVAEQCSDILRRVDEDDVEDLQGESEVAVRRFLIELEICYLVYTHPEFTTAFGKTPETLQVASTVIPWNEFDRSETVPY